MPKVAERVAELVDALSCADKYMSVTINIHGCTTYEEAREILRRAGLGKVDKHPNKDCSWISHVELVKGAVEDCYIGVTAFHKGLPPTCRLVKETVKVPKTSTVDTGEFIEMQVDKVVCDGGGEDE